MEDFIAYEQFGNHSSLDEQPAEWVDAMMALSTAKDIVKRKIENEQEERRQKKAEAERNKSKKGRRR